MSTRSRIISGLSLALAVGLLGPMLSAVATHTGNGHSAIRGRVTDPSGAPIEGICAIAYHDYLLQGTLPEDEPLLPVAGSTTTLADGSYAIGRLTNDRYRVKFEQCLEPPHARRYVTEWYDDSLVAEHATPVETVYGYDAYGVDAVLTAL